MADIFVPKSTCAPIKEIADHFGVDYDDALHIADACIHEHRDTDHQDEVLAGLNLSHAPFVSSLHRYYLNARRP